MKVIFLLLVVSSVCRTSCPSDQFWDGALCLPCSGSPCGNGGCDGTGNCKTCPGGIELIDGTCVTCTDASKIIVNKACKACTDFGAEGDFREGCFCETGTANCCTQPGVYKSGSECRICRFSRLGCTECGYSSTLQRLMCTKCVDGLKLEPAEGYGYCEPSFGSILLPAVALIIALFTLL